MECLSRTGTTFKQRNPSTILARIRPRVEGLGGEPEGVMAVHPGSLGGQIEILMSHCRLVLGFFHRHCHLLEHLTHRAGLTGAPHGCPQRPTQPMSPNTTSISRRLNPARFAKGKTGVPNECDMNTKTFQEVIRAKNPSKFLATNGYSASP